MRLLATALLTIVATATTTASAQNESYPRGCVIGSIEIPALHDAVNSDLPDQPAALSLVTLYVEPTEHTAVAAVVSDRSEHLWLQVELLDGSVCETAEQPAVVTRGWIPAFSAGGQLVAWHYPRGC